MSWPAALPQPEVKKVKTGRASPPRSKHGLAYSQQGNYARALEYYQKARAQRRLGRKDAIASTLSNYRTLIATGKYETALPYYKKSLTLDEEAEA